MLNLTNTRTTERDGDIDGDGDGGRRTCLVPAPSVRWQWRRLLLLLLGRRGGVGDEDMEIEVAVRQRHGVMEMRRILSSAPTLLYIGSKASGTVFRAFTKNVRFDVLVVKPGSTSIRYGHIRPCQCSLSPHSLSLSILFWTPFSNMPYDRGVLCLVGFVRTRTTTQCYWIFILGWWKNVNCFTLHMACIWFL
jgi:hypothetical protein